MKIGIVGLGIVGLSAAARLAELGHEVHGFEQFDLLHDRGSSHGDTRIFRRHPFEGEVYVDLAAKAYDGWHRWSAEAGEALFMETGGIHAALPESRYVANVQAFNPHAQMMTAAEANKRWPIFNIPDDHAVVFDPQNGYLRPDATRVFLADKAQKVGAQLHFNRSVDLHGDGQLNKEQFDAIIITAGPWLSSLVPEMSSLLTVERRVMGWFKVEPAVAPENLIAFRIGEEFYGMPTPSGHVKLGMNKHFSEIVDLQAVADVDQRDRDYIDQQSGRCMRNIATHAYQYKRCLYALTPDEDFIVDRHPDHERVFIISCCSGHGFKYGPAYGDLAADLLDGRIIPQFSLNRFKA